MLTQRNQHPRSTSAGPVGRRSRRRTLGACLGGIALVASALAGSAPVAVATPSSAAAIPVTIRLAEYRLDMPRLRFLPRTYTFTAVNIGRAPHALAISGPGHIHRSTPVLAPGQSAHLTLRLHQGKYEFTCPVGNHTQRGMRTSITAG